MRYERAKRADERNLTRAECSDIIRNGWKDPFQPNDLTKPTQGLRPTHWSEEAMAKSPRFASSRFVIITPEATLSCRHAAYGLPFFCFRSMWSDSKAGGTSL